MSEQIHPEAARLIDEAKAKRPPVSHPFERPLQTKFGELIVKVCCRDRAVFRSSGFLSCGRHKVQVKGTVAFLETWKLVDRFETSMANGRLFDHAVGREKALAFQTSLVRALSIFLTSNQRLLIESELVKTFAELRSIDSRIETVEGEILRRQEKLSALRALRESKVLETDERVADLRAELLVVSCEAPRKSGPRRARG